MKAFQTYFSIILASALVLCNPTYAKPVVKILFVRPSDKAFEEVFESMKKDLSRKYEISSYLVSKSSSFDDFKKTIQNDIPQLLVLMDNKAVDLTLKYNSDSLIAEKKIPGVALMGLNLKNILKANSNIAGIAYESPAFSLVTHFRTVIETPVKTVLTFYRESRFHDEIELTRKQLATADIKLIAINVEKNGKDLPSIEKFLGLEAKNIITQGKYEAVWLMLDSNLYSQNLFERVWLPLSKESKLPFLTGLEHLVSKELDFATFAVTPNLSELASQANQMIESILSDGVAPKDLGVETLIAVDEILNLLKANEIGIKLRNDKLTEIKVLK